MFHQKKGLIMFGVFWAAANGGVTNGGLRGVWPPFPGIGRNRPFSPFFCLFRPFPEGLKSTWKIQETEEKGLFPQISSDFLKPPSLKPPVMRHPKFLDFTEHPDLPWSLSDAWWFRTRGSERPEDSPNGRCISLIFLWVFVLPFVVSSICCCRWIFIHLQCWEVLPFLTIQRQRCIKFRVLRAQDFYTPLALKTGKGQHLAALEVYKNQSPICCCRWMAIKEKVIETVKGPNMPECHSGARRIKGGGKAPRLAA